MKKDKGNSEGKNRVRYRPDLRAKLDQLFDEQVAKEPEVKDSQNKLDYYFDSYSHYGIHEDMLRDKARTKAYEMAITKSPELFKDKIVLDVGCGTGVLSIFAVKAGAKHVYAVDNANIYLKAKEIVDLNGFKDKITVINGKIEEIELPVKEVDIIISEWMGYLLLYEGMFDSVIFAREKWLRKDGKGMLFPNRASMFVKGIDDINYWREKMDFWNSVYGYDYRSFQKWIQLEPLVETCPINVISTEESCILDLDLMTATKKDLDFSSTYRIKSNINGHINGLVIWFDVAFTFGKKPVFLSTRTLP